MKNEAPITVFESEFVTVWYHPDTKIVHHKLNKFIFGEAFRDGMNAGAEAMEKYRATKWLSDDRNNSALLHEDLEWADKEWFSRVQTAGWKFWAIVLPKTTVGRMNMQRIAKSNTERGVITEVFSDPDEAMAWLVQQ